MPSNVLSTPLGDERNDGDGGSPRSNEGSRSGIAQGVGGLSSSISEQHVEVRPEVELRKGGVISPFLYPDAIDNIPVENSMDNRRVRDDGVNRGEGVVIDQPVGGQLQDLKSSHVQPGNRNVRPWDHGDMRTSEVMKCVERIGDVSATLNKMTGCNRGGSGGHFGEHRGEPQDEVMAASMLDAMSLQDASRVGSESVSDDPSCVPGVPSQTFDAWADASSGDASKAAIFCQHFRENVDRVLMNLEKTLGRQVAREERRNNAPGGRIGRGAMRATGSQARAPGRWRYERKPWPQVHHSSVLSAESWSIPLPLEPDAGGADEIGGAEGQGSEDDGVPPEDHYPIGCNPSGRLQLLEFVGKGSFGQVYKALCVESGMYVAVKLVKGTEENLSAFIREGEMGVMLRHDSIVKTLNYRVSEGKSCKDFLRGLGFGVDQFDTGADGSNSADVQVEFLLEFCDLGKLTDHIYKEGGIYVLVTDIITSSSSSSSDDTSRAGDTNDSSSSCMAETGPSIASEELVPSKVDAIALLALDIISGLIYLEAHGVVHGDLSGNNIMLSTDFSSPTGIRAKIGDFGHIALADEHVSFNSSTGTISHMPLEFLQEGKRSTRSDLYSLAVTVHELWTGEQFWQGMSTMQIMYNITQHHDAVRVHDSIPDQLRDVLIVCLHQEETHRISLSTAFALFAKLITPDLLSRQLKRY